MTLMPEIEETLTAVGRIMGNARDPWCLIGGAAAALWGATSPAPADVDVLLSVGDLERVLAENRLASSHHAGTDRFRSMLFCAFDGLAAPVDFMAGFRVFSKGRWVPVLPNPVRRVAVNKAHVWVPSIADLIAMYRLFERPKDAARIAALSALPA